ncbi:hypothetical protein MLD38_021087 [Melastoma candidum]|uniref:Uncharacterized protein n=1 Tax=Melastoma candidum TaxID=119954 RepID=A0ACB9QGV3_9MYRT|nr:hypothetical protein MLD38_021087 [Melastoma candidum]
MSDKGELPSQCSHQFRHACRPHPCILYLGNGITKGRVDILEDFPGIVSSSATILRLWDDLGSARDENQDGHDGSYVEYCKKEHPGCSDASVRARVEDLIGKEWKKLNRECLLPREFPKSFCKVCLGPDDV